MSTIQMHHATAAKAKRLGFTFDRDEEGIVAIYEGAIIASSVTPTEALALAIERLEKAVDAPAGAIDAWAKAHPKKAKAEKKAPARRVRDEDDEQDEDEDEGDEQDDDEDVEALEEQAEEEDEESAEGKSVVKKKYKTRYRPFKHRNGDDIGKLVTEHVAERDEKGEIVQPVRTDPDLLEDFAKANGVWNDEYNRLNIGMRRMNIGNRIRSKVKKGEEIVWN